MLTSLEVASGDPSYPWVLEMLSQHERLQYGKVINMGLISTQTSPDSTQTSPDSSQMMTPLNSPLNINQNTLGSNWGNKWGKALKNSFLPLFQPPPPHVLSVKTNISKRKNGTSETQMTIVPGVGKYFIRYKKAWIQVERTRETKMVDLKTGSPWETLLLTTLAMDKGVFSELLSESRQKALQKQVGRTVIYVSYGPEWREFGQARRKRDFESVVLTKRLSSEILADVKQFLGNEKWYSERGIPYRRGYLLHGPPGTGKTSFIQALAGALDYNVCVMNLSERGMTDDRLAHLLSTTPAQSLLLLEDVDAVFQQRASSQGLNLVTFSGLLNALDGVASAEERLIFMTTNHLDRLDPALIRPGRVDARFLIDYAQDDQIARMFARFFPLQDHLQTEFAQKVRLAALKFNHGNVSSAQLQGHFVLFRTDAQQAIANVDFIFR